jgi:hypothetical protein
MVGVCYKQRQRMLRSAGGAATSAGDGGYVRPAVLLHKAGGAATSDGGFCYQRLTVLLLVTVASATSGRWRCYKRQRLLPRADSAATSDNGVRYVWTALLQAAAAATTVSVCYKGVSMSATCGASVFYNRQRRMLQGLRRR